MWRLATSWAAAACSISACRRLRVSSTHPHVTQMTSARYRASTEENHNVSSSGWAQTTRTRAAVPSFDEVDTEAPADALGHARDLVFRRVGVGLPAGWLGHRAQLATKVGGDGLRDRRHGLQDVEVVCLLGGEPVVG